MGWLEWITGILSALIIFVCQDAYRSRKDLKVAKKDLVDEKEQCKRDMENAQNDEISGLVKLQIANIKQDLYDAHEKYINKGYMPGFIKESLETKYNFYHDHGANGVGTKLFNELMELPEYKKGKINKEESK